MNTTASSAPQAPDDWLSELKFDAQGLIPAIAQDADSGAVLMMAWMNAQAVQETARTGQAVYFSRSRNRLWRKGEESGNTQTVREIRLDCDGDVLLLRVTQVGGIACHTGRASCFFRRLDAASIWDLPDAANGPAEPGQVSTLSGTDTVKPGQAGASGSGAYASHTWTVTDPVLKDPRDLYSHPHSHHP